MKIDENKLCSAVRKKSQLYKTIFPKHEDDPLTNFSKIVDKIFIGNQDAAKDFKFFNWLIWNNSIDLLNKWGSEIHLIVSW